MRSSFAVLGFIGAIGVMLSPSTARAAEEAPEKSSTPPVRELSFRGSVGGYDDIEANTGGFNFGGTALYRHDLLLAGALVEHGSALFGYQYTAIAPAAGVSLPVPSWARVEIFVTAGAHLYKGFGGGFLDPDPGASAAVPFAGSRLYAGVPLGGKAFAFTAGFSGWVEADVFRPNVTYTFTDSFFGPPEKITNTRNVGTSRAGIALVLGGTFGI